ncbi:MAG: hypothetical protein ACK4OO_02630 [bacterium]
MSINLTLAYHKASLSWQRVYFSGTVTTFPTYLKGAGGEAGDGFPLVKAGQILSLTVWDGTILWEATGAVPFQKGDRLSVRAIPAGGITQIVVTINGIDTQLSLNGVNTNVPLFVTVEMLEQTEEN